MGVRVVFPDMGKDPSVQLIEKTITENGTYDAITDGANGYSKVNVNVGGGGGSSDFSIATLTLTNGTGIVNGALATDNGSDYMGRNGTTYKVILYKGRAYVFFPNKVVKSTTGSIELVESNVGLVTGDCTVELKSLN